MHEYIDKKLLSMEKMSEVLRKNMSIVLKNIHDFFNEKYSFYNISLRDLERFYKLFNFFCEMLKKKKSI